MDTNKSKRKKNSTIIPIFTSPIPNELNTCNENLALQTCQTNSVCAIFNIAKLTNLNTNQLKTIIKFDYQKYKYNGNRITQLFTNTLFRIVTVHNEFENNFNTLQTISWPHIQSSFSNYNDISLFVAQWNSPKCSVQNKQIELLIIDYFDCSLKKNNFLTEFLPLLYQHGICSQKTIIYLPNTIQYSISAFQNQHLYSVKYLQKEFHPLYLATETYINLETNRRLFELNQQQLKNLQSPHNQPFLQIQLKSVNEMDKLNSKLLKMINNVNSKMIISDSENESDYIQLESNDEDDFSYNSDEFEFPEESEQLKKKKLNQSISTRESKRALKYLSSPPNQLKCCVKKCVQKLDNEQITNLRIEFQSKRSRDQRSFINSFIQERAESDEKKKRFCLLETEICYDGMKNIFAVSLNMLSPPLISRGNLCHFRERSAEKSNLICHWLDEYARSQDPIPNKSIIQFCNPNKSSVFYIFSECQKIKYAKESNETKENNLCSKSLFLQVWRSRRNNFKIRKVLAFAKCSTCEIIRNTFSNTRDKIQLESSESQFKKHIVHVQNERILYRKKREFASDYQNSCISLIVDGTAQGSWGLPFFAQKTKDTSEIFKLETHITGVLVHGHGSYIYTCPPKFQQGTNLAIEVIQRTLIDIETKYNARGRHLPDRFYLQLDNTCKENRNKIMFSFLDMLLRRKVFKEIFISFLPVGHTHEDIDQMFSRLSTYVRVRNIQCRSELYKAFRNAYKFKSTNEPPKCEHLDSIINYSGFMESSKSNSHYANTHGIADASTIRHFKYTIIDGVTQLSTRASARDQSWVPWKNGPIVKLTAPKVFKNVPSSIMRILNDENVAKIKSGEKKIREKKVIDENSSNENLKDIEQGYDVKTEVKFRWKNNGQFMKERFPTKYKSSEFENENENYVIERSILSDEKIIEEINSKIPREELVKQFIEEMKSDKKNEEIESVEKSFEKGVYVAFIQELDDSNEAVDKYHRFLIGKIEAVLDTEGELNVHQYRADQEYEKYMPLWKESRLKLKYLSTIFNECVICTFKRTGKLVRITLSENEKEIIESGVKAYQAKKKKESKRTEIENENENENENESGSGSESESSDIDSDPN